MTYENKRIAVIGMARTGLAVAEALMELGARVTIFDRKSAEELAYAATWPAAIDIELSLGSEDVDLTGFDTVVVSPGVLADKMGLPEAVRVGIEVISEIELAWRISKAPIIAITGTNGKTTTTVLAGLMLRASGFDAYIAGNVAGAGLPDDGKTMIPLVTAAHKASPESIIVAEISSFQLEWISGFKPKVAALLNVTQDHLDRHKSVQEYADYKARIFANQDKSDFAIVNLDDPVASEFLPTCSCNRIGSPLLYDKIKGRCLPFSRHTEVAEGAYFRGDDLVVSLGGKETVVCARPDIRLRGEHNLENILAATCASMSMGASAEDIKQTVRTFGGVTHRMESVITLDGTEYVNNSMCTNVDAAVRSIESIIEPLVVICGGRDKGLDYGPLAKVFSRKVKHAVLFGEARSLIHVSVAGAGYDCITEAGSLNDAVQLARNLADPGDVVMLVPVCSSFDMFQSFEDRGNAFKKIVKEMANQ